MALFSYKGMRIINVTMHSRSHKGAVTLLLDRQEPGAIRAFLRPLLCHLFHHPPTRHTRTATRHLTIFPVLPLHKQDL